MKTVTVQKAELQAKVRKNREAHRAIFLEAVEGYKTKVLKILEGHILDVKAGRVNAVRVTLPEPEDHTADYDRVLTMLSMSVDDEIELNEDAFAQYVMDDWHWKRQFITSSSNYSAIARRQL